MAGRFRLYILRCCAQGVAAGLCLASALAASPGIAPGAYPVDAARTVVNFSVRQFAVTRLTGKFVEPTGALVVDPAHAGRANLDVSFPIAKLSTGKLSADALLKGRTMFEADKYPQARFVARDVPVAAGSASVAGALTLHGVTRPTMLTVHFDGVPAGTGLHCTGSTSIQRSEFGMGFGRPFVSNQVDLVINATFRSPTALAPAPSPATQN